MISYLKHILNFYLEKITTLNRIRHGYQVNLPQCSNRCTHEYIGSICSKKTIARKARIHRMSRASRPGEEVDGLVDAFPWGVVQEFKNLQIHALGDIHLITNQLLFFSCLQRGFAAAIMLVMPCRFWSA